MTLYEKIMIEKEISRDEGGIRKSVDLIERQISTGCSFEDACEILKLTPEEADECRKYMETGLYSALS